MFVSFKRIEVYILIGEIQQKNKKFGTEERGDGGGLEKVGGVGPRAHLEELALYFFLKFLFYTGV